MAKKEAKKGKKCDVVGLISIILLIIGGLNWALVGIFNGFDLVRWALGSIPILQNIVYILVGAAAVYALINIKKHK